MKLRLPDIRLFVLIFLGFIVSVASTRIVRDLSGVHRLELLAYDWYVQSLPVLPPDDRIVIVGMDDESLFHLPVDRRSYPLPRTLHARLLQELHDAGAKVVGFDVMFIGDAPREDEIFARAMQEQKNVLSGVRPQGRISEGDEAFRFSETATLLRPHVRQCSVLASAMYGRVRWLMPSVLDEATGKRYMHMSMALAASYLGAPDGDGLLDDTFRIGSIQAPVGRDRGTLIRFAGPAETFKPIPYQEVYNGDWRRTRGGSFFKDKIVLVGVINPLVDRALTPLGNMQGVEILAQATQAILASNWITHWSEAASYFFKVLLVSVLAIAIWTLGLRRAVLVAAIEATVWILIAYEAFAWRGIWVDTVEPIATLALGLVVFTSYEAARILISSSLSGRDNP